MSNSTSNSTPNATSNTSLKSAKNPIKTEIEHLDGHVKKVTVEVPAENVILELTQYFRAVQREVELNGFRKGKAPLDVIKKMYSSSATGRVTQEIVQKTLGQALKEHSLNPITMPDIDAAVLIENAPFKYTATFEVSPPVDLKNYTGLTLKKEDTTISDEEITKTMESIRAQVAQYQDLPEGTVAEKGTFVQLEYEGSEAGEILNEASDKNGFFELGAAALAPDFENNLLGMKAGEEKAFTINFPLPEEGKEPAPVAGKTIDFIAKITALKSRVLPELNDELAKKLGPFNGIEDLKTRIIEDLRREKTQKYQRELQEKAIDFLIEENPVEAPQTLVNRQMEQLAVDAGMQLSQMGLDEKTIEERLKGWGDDMLQRATRQIKVSLLLSAIASKENIQANDEDLRQEITRIAAQAQKSPKDVLEDFKNRDLIGGLVRQVTEMKALDWVVQKATA